MSDSVDDRFDMIEYFGDCLSEWYLGIHIYLYFLQDVVDERQHLPDLVVKYFRLVPSYHTRVVVEIRLPGLDVDVDVVYYVVLSSEPLFVQYDHVFLRCHQSFLDINGDL